MTPDIELPPVDVLVVGLGPVGATVANLLGRYGVRALVIDRAQEIFAAPRAIVLDNEALRILQMAGLEPDAFDCVPIPRVRMRSPVFGEYARANTAGAIDGHPKLVTFYQPDLEAVLRRRLALYPTVEVRTGVELLGIETKTSSVVARLGLGDRTASVSARYLVAADGASSLVREFLGLSFEGRTFSQDWLIVDAKQAPQPIDDIEFWCDSDRPGPHMIAPGGRQRWEFMLRPGETLAEEDRHSVARELLRPWTKGAEVEIERLAVYRFHARTARSFSAGRCHLVGDAAHITPPFAGQGLVAGLRDAANLSWKLAWVIKGRCAPAILESYDVERRPHAKAMIRFALFMGALVMPRSRLKALLVHGAMLVSRYVPGLSKSFEELKFKPENRFRRGLFLKRTHASRLRPGGQFPQVILWESHPGRVVASDDALGERMMLVGLGVDASARIDPALKARWEACGGGMIRIVAAGTAPAAAANCFEDLAGDLVPNVIADEWVAIVRPDRVVIAEGAVADAAQLLARTLDLLGAAEGHAIAACEMNVEEEGMGPSRDAVGQPQAGFELAWERKS